MSPSLLSHIYVRPELFQKGQLVYLRRPEGESDEGSRALARLREQVGGGPFRVSQITDTPSSHAAPQMVILARENDVPLMTEDGPLEISGYYLSSDSQ